MWEKFKQLKQWVVEKVLWAEKELSGKTGAEKRAAIIQRLDDLIKLPFWLEWADGPLIGWVVDLVCDKLNWLTDHGDWEAVTPEQGAELAEVLTAETSRIDTRGKTVDERLEELYREYGIERPAKPTTGGDLTKNFLRKEFACKCGCGFADVNPKLVELCETIRQAVGAPVRVNSGCRCEKHNKKVGGTANSYHTQGKAADLSCSIGANKLYELIQALYSAGKLPGLAYCLKYPSFVHIDIGSERKQRFAVRK